MRHVEIAADNHRPLLGNVPDIGEECIVEFQFVVEVSHRLDPQREIDIEQEKTAVIRDKDPPFVVKHRVAKTEFYRYRFFPEKSPTPAVLPGSEP